MTKYLHTNNASSNLRTTINAVVTSIQVTSGQGVLFPNPVTGEGFFVTVEDRRIGRLEIMLCTSRISDTLTVVRGQQGTIPQSFGAGVNVSNRVTAQVLNDFVAITNDVIPVAQIPPITDAMMAVSGIDANKTTAGIFNVLRIPPITTDKIVSLDAAKLTGTIPAARLPNPLPVGNLPPIPPASLTTVPAAILTGAGTLPSGVLPAIPASKLTSVPAGNLTGTVPNASLSTTYNNIVSLGGSGNATFNRFFGAVLGAVTPTYSFSGASDGGLGYNTSLGPYLSFGGVAGFAVNGTLARVLGATVFSGNGSGLTHLDATELVGNVPSANLTTAMHATVGAAPMYSIRAWGRFTLGPSPTIQGDGNFATIANLGGSQYRLTFTVPMASINYSVVAMTSSGNPVLVTFNAAYFVIDANAGSGETLTVQVIQ